MHAYTIQFILASRSPLYWPWLQIIWPGFSQSAFIFR